MRPTNIGFIIIDVYIFVALLLHQFSPMSIGFPEHLNGLLLKPLQKALLSV